MLFRFQLTDQAFALMLRGRFQRQDLCVPAPIIPDPENPTYIDHIEFVGAEPLGASILQAGSPKPLVLPLAGNATVPMSVPTLVLSRTVGIYTTTLNDLKAAGSNAPSTVRLPLTLQFAVSVDHTTTIINGVSTAIDQLTISYYGNGLTPDEIAQLKTTKAQLDGQLKALLPTVSSPIDFSSAFSSFGAGTFRPVSVWSGIGASADFSLVEIRVEFSSNGTQGVADQASWTAFYDNQNLDNIVNDQDWAFFIEQDMLLGIVNSLVAPALQAPSKTFRLESGPTCSWNASAPGVVVQFSGDAIDACQCAWGQIDVGENLTLQVNFSANDGWCRVDLRLANSSNQFDILCCELTATVLWPFVGLGQTDQTFVGRLGYIGGIVFPPAVFVFAVKDASGTSPPIPPVNNFQGDPSDPSHLFADVSVTGALRSPDDSFALTFITGSPDGLVMGGTHTDNNLRPASIEAVASEFKWIGPAVNCSGATGVFMAQAGVAVTRASGDLDFGYCAVTVFPDTWQANLSVSFGYGPFSVSILLSTTTYSSDVVSVLIQTTGGLRYITFRPMTALTQQMVKEQELLMEAWRLENCFKLIAPWSRYFAKFNPKWLVDPPEGDTGQGETQRLWITAIGGFNVGDRVVLAGQNNETIQTAFASSSGAVYLNAIVNAPEIGMTRLPAEDTASADAGKPSVTQKQLLLRQIASIPVTEPVLAMQGIPGRFSAGLLIATRSGLRSFSLDSHGVWKLSSSSLGQNLAGAFSSGGRLWAWTAAGEIVDLPSTAGSSGLSPTLVSAIQGRLAAAGPRGFTHAALVGDQLLVLEASSVRSLDFDFPVVPGYDLTSLSRVGSSSFLVHTSSGDYRMYSQSSAGGFGISAIYADRPWFEGSITLGSWTLILSEDRKSVQIMALVAQQTL